MRERILRAIATFSQEQQRPPTVRDICQVLGVQSTGHISYHLKQLVADHKIEKAPGSSRSIRLTDGRATTRTRVAARSTGMMAVPRVRLMGTIAAGQPLLVSPEVDEYVDLISPREGLYALRIKGTSMIGDHIQDGDVVIVEACDTVRDGEMAVALIREAADDPGEATLKRLYREPDGRVRLQPSNPEMEALYYPARQVVVQGRVHAVLREC
jgi:repressor LexA